MKKIILYNTNDNNINHIDNSNNIRKKSNDIIKKLNIIDNNDYIFNIKNQLLFINKLFLDEVFIEKKYTYSRN